MRIIVTIATYNEKENIEKLIREVFGLPVDDLSIVIVDDSSPDGTSDIVRNLQKEFSPLHLIERKNERGLGSAIITGFKFALDHEADIVFSMDADLSHPPQDIPKMIEAINDGADMVIASRKIKGGKIIGWDWKRKFSSTGVMIASKLVLGLKTMDVTTDFRAYKKETLKAINLDRVESRGYSFVEELLYMVESRGLKVKEVPSTFVNRQEGKSKSSLKEVLPFFGTLVKIRIRNFKFNSKSLIFIVLGLSFFIGIWHAFPLLNIVDDEMYFVGGALRAMENFSIFPASGDVPYGTVTYFLNYGLIAIALLVMLPFFKFNITGLKDYLVQSPEVMYYFPRVLSAILGLVALSVINKFLKKEIEDVRSRIFLLILLFTNMMTALFFHTGKMWVLSTLLIVTSFYYLYQALACQKDDVKLRNRSVFLSILFACIATANFAFYVIFLINIPMAIIFFWRDKFFRLKLIKYVVIGVVVLLAIILTNFNTVTGLVVYHATEQADIYQGAGEIYQPIGDYISPVTSFVLYLKRLIAFFPLLLLTLLIVCFDKVKNKRLLIVSLVYFAVYFIPIVLITKQSAYIHSNIRYSFPFVFFLIFIIASFNVKFRKVFYVLGSISVIYFAFTLYYLSVPTTYNLAYDWIIDNLNQNNIIVNDVSFIQLPKNQESYSLVRDYFCASKCQKVIEGHLNNNIDYLVVDEYTKENIVLPNSLDKYHIGDVEFDGSDYELIRRFVNGTDIDFALDDRMANYFDWRFFLAKRFGPDIYIHKQIK